MATTTCNIRMDKELKDRFDATAARIGMPTSTAFNVFARKFVARGGFPFEVTAEPVYVDFASEGEVAELMDELSMEVLADER